MTLRQSSFEWDAPANLRREDFVVSDCNQSALEWIEIWPHWGNYGSILWGDAGSGKSHLAHIWAKKSHAVFLSNDWDDAAWMKMVMAQNAVIADHADVHLRPELLLHTLNAIKNKNGSILLLAQKPSQQWAVILPDLSSRLNALPQIEIQPPDDMMLQMLLAKLFADRQILVSPEVVDYAVKRLVRSYAAIQAFVDGCDRISLEKAKPITISLVRQILLQMEHHLTQSGHHE